MGKIRDKKIIDERAARRRKRKKPERYRQKIRVPLPQAQRQPRSIELWENILPNHPAFVIGNAPSLDACDLSLLEGCFTIGVNRVYDRIDPIILFWQDISVWFDEHKTIVTLEAIKVARDIADPHCRFFNFGVPDTKKYKFGPKPQRLHGTGNTGTLAVEMANAMGCSPIIILGMDCKVQGKKTDHFGHNKYWTKQTPNICRDGLLAIRDKCKTPILNCGDSGLWPKVSLADAMQELGNFERHDRAWYQKLLVGEQVLDRGRIEKKRRARKWSRRAGSHSG